MMRRQPKGVSGGGQFARDMSGKKPPSAKPDRMQGAFVEVSSAEIDAMFEQARAGAKCSAMPPRRNGWLARTMQERSERKTIDRNMNVLCRHYLRTHAKPKPMDDPHETDLYNSAVYLSDRGLSIHWQEVCDRNNVYPLADLSRAKPADLDRLARDLLETNKRHGGLPYFGSG